MSYGRPQERALPRRTQDGRFALCVRSSSLTPVFIKERPRGAAAAPQGCQETPHTSLLPVFSGTVLREMRDTEKESPAHAAGGCAGVRAGAGAGGGGCGRGGGGAGSGERGAGSGAGAAQAALLHSASPPLDGI